MYPLARDVVARGAVRREILRPEQESETGRDRRARRLGACTRAGPFPRRCPRVGDRRRPQVSRARVPSTGGAGHGAYPAVDPPRCPGPPADAGHERGDLTCQDGFGACLRA
ncbi:hypothetical protein CCE02nite_19750 [Cellulosimicrobium cellulans]|uniref:Uncharacterized protein n=1 Tax=Cellulosimicrobium cellulans TaxID=1710 RepID=A0A4Y4DY39_CELCE|nr:hypothetical protein CCE02nite_19750 [Cellulosimicrobium cellulans]